MYRFEKLINSNSAFVEIFWVEASNWLAMSHTNAISRKQFYILLSVVEICLLQRHEVYTWILAQNLSWPQETTVRLQMHAKTVFFYD